MGIIYQIKKNNKSVYVGQTIKTLDQRWKEHLRNAYSKNRENSFAIHDAIQKYGKENFSIELIEEVPNKELNTREKFWIKELKTHISMNGYNMTQGGESSSDAIKKHCYQYDIDGNFLKEFESVSAAAREVSGQSIIANILKAINGKIKIAYGYRWSYEKINKLPPITSNHTGIKKPINQYDIHGNFIRQYESAVEAAKILNKRPSTIRNAAIGNRQTAYGYRWSYI